MSNISQLTWRLALIVLHGAFVLVLVALKSAAADNHIPQGGPSRELSPGSGKRHALKRGAPPCRANSLTMDDNVTRTRGVHRPPAQDDDMVELQVPTALLQALQRSNTRGISTELHVPAILLETLQTEGRVELP